MSEWHRPSIGDLVDSHWSGEWGTDPDGGPDVARVYRSTEIDDHGHLRKGQGVPRTIPRFRDGKALKHGDILVESSGGAPNRPVGRVALAEFEDGRHFTSNFVRTLRPTQSVDGNWLRWKLHWLNNQSVIWRHQQQTTGIINLKIESYLNQEIAAPKDQKEQKRIASIIDLIDTQIEATEALIAKQERLRAGLMQDLFTRGVDENGELRPPREEAPHLYHETELGWLPKEWYFKSIETILSNIIDYRGVPPPKASNGVPLITAKNVRFGFLDPEPAEYILETDFNSWMRRGIPMAGDVLFTTEAPLGNIAQIPDYKIALGQRTLTLQPDERFVSQDFLKWLLMSGGVQRRIGRLQSGSTATGIQSKTFKKICVEVPPASEQCAIVDALQSLESKRELNISELGKLTRQKKALMQDLLTGTVSVEPLLEREPA